MIQTITARFVPQGPLIVGKCRKAREQSCCTVIGRGMGGKGEGEREERQRCARRPGRLGQTVGDGAALAMTLSRILRRPEIKPRLGLFPWISSL